MNIYQQERTSSRWQRRVRAPNRIHGFTLIEILMALALAATALILATPSLRTFTAINHVVNTGNAVVTGLNMARSYAIALNEPVTICPSINSTDCSNSNWHSGWIIFSDSNNDGNSTDSEILQVHQMLGHVTSTGDSGPVIFNDDGTTTSVEGHTITNCPADASQRQTCSNVTVGSYGKIQSVTSGPA